MKRLIFNGIWFLRSKIVSCLTFVAFPIYCINCGKQTSGIPLCENCISMYLMQWEDTTNRCTICGRRLISESNLCLECRESTIFESVDFVFPIHRYILWKKQLMFLWKSKGQRMLSPIFAKVLYKALKEQFPNIPIIPVPPRPGKIHKKGWDQIAELTVILKNIYNVQIVDALIRTEKVQQKKRNRKERLEHLGKAFQLSPKCKEIPEKVVILDDVMTTGATLESCAKCLKKAGAKKVFALTLFEVS